VERASGLTAVETDLRARLGIPADARRVLIFGETSHWDPNWLFTSEQYFRLRIRRILEAVIDELEAEPRRVFSVESLFFFRMFWERVPALRDRARALINRGQLRLTGSGITTPDTLIPDTEAILRDYLHGQEWLRVHGMTPEPRIAYLPDDFGHSPALPSVLHALGFEQAGITRIDGMYFVGTDLRSRRRFPLPGSSAELLLEKLRSLDFVWRGPDGAEVLCHWNAFTYFQGDMLAHRGIIRWMGLPLRMSWRTARHVARRIRGFVGQLEPLARTPYMFCPIGCDFIGPIPRLVELLDRYNGLQYPENGVWAVNAAMDDYLDLVACHRDALPELELDPNPYWMGFYASRPETKYRTNRTTCKLELAEKLAVRREGPPDGVQQTIRAAWDLVVVSNHHDFITGTSPDRVFHKEQRPLLREAESHADRALGAVCCEQCGDAAPSGDSLPDWRREGSRIELSTDHYRAVLDEGAGGCLVELWVGQHQMLAGPANDLAAHYDTGGLWRMGHEYLGGQFRERDRASLRPARLEARERPDGLEIRVESVLCGRPVVRWMWFDARSPIIRMRLVGSAATRRTITCRFPTTISAPGLVMDVPGGFVERPASKLYEPTFWPARTFAHMEHAPAEHGSGLAVFMGGPACVGITAAGVLEWVALRNVHREWAYGVFPLLAHPATGHDPEVHHFEYAVWFTRSGDFRDNRLPSQARRLMRGIWLPERARRLCDRAEDVVSTDDERVMVTTVKRADRGEGIIVRLQSFAPPGEDLQIRLRFGGARVRTAHLCDARERDLAGLPVEGRAAVVPVRRALTTVRLS